MTFAVGNMSRTGLGNGMCCHPPSQGEGRAVSVSHNREPAGRDVSWGRKSSDDRSGRRSAEAEGDRRPPRSSPRKIATGAMESAPQYGRSWAPPLRRCNGNGRSVILLRCYHHQFIYNIMHTHQDRAWSFPGWAAASISTRSARECRVESTHDSNNHDLQEVGRSN